MATRRSTGAGRSRTSSNNSGVGLGKNILNESIALDPNELLAMLAGEDSELEGGSDEEAEQDCAVRTDLDGMFAGVTDPSGSAELGSERKRKRGSSEQPGVHVCGHVCVSCRCSCCCVLGCPRM